MRDGETGEMMWESGKWGSKMWEKEVSDLTNDNLYFEELFS